MKQKLNKAQHTMHQSNNDMTLDSLEATSTVILLGGDQEKDQD